jgi:hypothetical protein
MFLRKSVGVIVVCHPGYAHFARACMEAIDRQTLPFCEEGIRLGCRQGKFKSRT